MSHSCPLWLNLCGSVNKYGVTNDPYLFERANIGVYKTLDGNNIVYINGVARRPRPNGYQPLELK